MRKYPERAALETLLGTFAPMKTDDLSFPVGCFQEDLFFTAKAPEGLTLNTRLGLRRGWFDGMEIIDSTGRRCFVTGARKLHGVGRFWGWNIFLNQWIRVELDIKDTGETVSLEDFKSRVLKDLTENRDIWESGGDFTLKEDVEKAQSVAEILQRLTRYD